MTKHSLLLAAGLLLTTSNAWAQLGFGKPKDVAAVKSQLLIVVLKDEEPSLLKKLAKKPDELADYKAYIADHNIKMQELAPKLWNFFRLRWSSGTRRICQPCVKSKGPNGACCSISTLSCHNGTP